MNVNIKNLKWYGRFFDSDNKAENIRFFNYSASGFEFCFTGTKATATIVSDSQNWDETTFGVLGVYISELNNPSEYKSNSFWSYQPESLSKKLVLSEQTNICTLFEAPEEKTVVIKVIKLSEAAFGYAGLKSIDIDGKQNFSSSSDINPLKLEIIGDSITCGYGIEGVYMKDVFSTKQERADLSYAFLTAKALNADFQCCSWSGIGLISKYVDPSINIPETSISMPLLWPYTDRSAQLRLNIEPSIWDESQFSPDIAIIHLGTNDSSFVRKLEDRRLLYVHALRCFIEQVHRRSPKAKICCCLGAMGQDLCKSVEEAVSLFNKDFPSVPTKTVKFPVQKDEDGIATDWHPSAATHKKIANQLSEALKNW